MPNSVRSAVFAALTAAILVLPLTAAARPFAGDSASASSKNLHPLGVSEKLAPSTGPGILNSDLAFWGDLAVQGNYEGFRIVDVSAPGKPKELVDFRGCVEGTTTGAEGDVIVWGTILVRAWNTPAPADTSCGGVSTPAGQGGLHVFDISNPANPVGRAFVQVPQGSHTVTAVPDPANNRLLVYSSASSSARAGIDIVQIPLDNPAGASVLRFLPAGRACHDTGVILGDVMLAACAGGNGFTVWSLDPDDGGSLDDPAFVYSRAIPGITAGHSAAFSWDGRILVFGHEPGGGNEPRCQAGSPAIDKSLFFFEAHTGVELGRWTLPRPQTAAENCALNNFNVVPTDKGNVLVSGNYQAGIAVVDFTDPARAVEIAYADPDPLDPAQLGGDWAAYWYDGFVYESDSRRGLATWRLSDSAVAGARKLGHLNPQTQETSFELRRPTPIGPTTGSFTLLGHEPLLNRGMNAALAVHGDYAYVGSRTDGHDPENSNNAGIMVVDISDPTHPTIARQIGPPLEGNMGESSREMRVWRSQEILIVLHTNCGGEGAHGCHGPSINNFRFYDISGANAANPQLILQFNRNTHEVFLWEDPANPERALLFGGSAGSQWQIWDISPVLQGQEPITLFSGSSGYGGGGLHSLSVSNDGTRAYFALLTGGFAVVDVSDFTAGRPSPQYRQITPSANRPRWSGPGAHSAVKLWNRSWVYVSDEVYGTATAPGHGCPWGWARMIDIADPTRPTVRAEFKLPQNYDFLCSEYEPRPRTSFSAHNPTLTPNIVFTTWHSSGFQAIGVEDPTYPYQLGAFMPTPLPQVGMEDPRLSEDDQKVVMWSYPVVQDGLIYVVDLRNGLYVLRYEGPFDGEVNDIGFLEGNSNQGHALCYEPVSAAPGYCRSLRGELEAVRDELEAHVTGGDTRSDRALDKALRALAVSLETRRWLDGTHLRGSLGRNVFDGAVTAVTELRSIDGDPAWATGAIVDIAGIGEALAAIAVDEAPAGQAKNAATREKARGDAARAAGNYANALAQYRKAWALVSED